jgi:gluconate 2-dehydrogenase subunit 3-like protein
MTGEIKTAVEFDFRDRSALRFRSYSRKPEFENGYDCPALSEEPLNLFTLPYAELIESLSDALFPPTQVQGDGGVVHALRASDARVDRHVHFRAAWQPSFGSRLQLALRDLTQASLTRHSGKHFRQLVDTERVAIVSDLQSARLHPTEWTVLRSQADAFTSIHDAITCGLMAEPGYGGNAHGLGWYYTRFMTIED